MTGQSVRTTARTQAERRAASRRRLLDASIECLAEMGYARTTFAEVLSRAGLSNGAMWRHFPSKVDLLVAAMQETGLLAPDEEEAAALVGMTAAERLDAAVERLWLFARSPAGQASVELLRASRGDAELRAALAASDYAAGHGFFDALRSYVGPELAQLPSFEVVARWLGLSTYGVAVTQGVRETPMSTQRLHELQTIARALFGIGIG
jgi:AcrR family transcriptional regulator